MRSHARTLWCSHVIGYKEQATIHGDVCILSVSGTAAVVRWVAPSTQEPDIVPAASQQKQVSYTAGQLMTSRRCGSGQWSNGCDGDAEFCQPQPSASASPQPQGGVFLCCRPRRFSAVTIEVRMCKFVVT